MPCFLLTLIQCFHLFSPGARQNQLGVALLFSCEIHSSPLTFDIRKVCFTLSFVHQAFLQLQPYGDMSLAGQLRGLLSILDLLVVHLFYLPHIYMPSCRHNTRMGAMKVRVWQLRATSYHWWHMKSYFVCQREFGSCFHIWGTPRSLFPYMRYSVLLDPGQWKNTIAGISADCWRKALNLWSKNCCLHRDRTESHSCCSLPSQFLWHATMRGHHSDGSVWWMLH